MTYDVHAHCIPSALIDLLEADGHRFGIEVFTDEKGLNALFAGRVKAGPLRPFLTDRVRRLETMDRAGIDVQIMSSWIDMTAYALEGRGGATYSRRLNEMLAEEAASAPGRFLALATAPLQTPEAAAEELRYAIVELGMVGVEIATTVDGTDLDQAGLDTFWAAAAELSCPILIHPYQPLAGVEWRNNLDNLVGRPAETTLAIGNLMLSGVFDRHPDLKIVLVHGGGFLPFQLGRLDHGFRIVPHLTARNATRSPRGGCAGSVLRHGSQLSPSGVVVDFPGRSGPSGTWYRLSLRDGRSRSPGHPPGHPGLGPQRVRDDHRWEPPENRRQHSPLEAMDQDRDDRLRRLAPDKASRSATYRSRMQCLQRQSRTVRK